VCVETRPALHCIKGGLKLVETFQLSLLAIRHLINAHIQLATREAPGCSAGRRETQHSNAHRPTWVLVRPEPQSSDEKWRFWRWEVPLPSCYVCVWQDRQQHTSIAAFTISVFSTLGCLDETSSRVIVCPSSLPIEDVFHSRAFCHELQCGRPT